MCVYISIYINRAPSHQVLKIIYLLFFRFCPKKHACFLASKLMYILIQFKAFAARLLLGELPSRDPDTPLHAAKYHQPKDTRWCPPSCQMLSVGLVSPRESYSCIYHKP